MNLNNIWGYGQLFGFSALDGVNHYFDDFIGTLTAKRIGIRFELREWIKIYFPITGRIKFKAVTSDLIDANSADGRIVITFADADTLVGYSPVLPIITGKKKLSYQKSWNVSVYCNEFDCIGMQYESIAEGYKFCIHHSQSNAEARSGANYYMSADVDSIVQNKYLYFQNLPKCKDKKFERLYYKALSVNKVNVRSAEGKIPYTWTTPDRIPHRHMWLWDSVFHALAIVNYNQELAKSAIRAVLSQIKADGFMPHMMNPIDSSDVTQPQVLSWGVWEVYQKTHDKVFLSECVNSLEAYLEWDIEHRDENKNGLLEWLTEPGEIKCKCGESGLDDSPRFDFDENMDAVDFSAFLCHDAEYLSKIYNELGETNKTDKWRKTRDNVANQINNLLWDAEDGVYYDRLFDGRFSKILTPASFFPMFAKVPSESQAEKMIKVLTDENLLWTENCLSSVAKNNPAYSSDMWRGGVWLMLNYFVIKGLNNYGYTEISEKLRLKTLDMVNKWYKKTGAIFEFYDPEDKIAPYFCERKGKPVNPPDWRKHVHSVIDFNWSACFTLLFIQNELY